jgi:hypothetical protein
MKEIPTVQEIEGAGTLQRKATLGKLLKRLRAKVELDPELDAYLSAFLEDRNRFVHHLIEGGNANASQEEIYRYYRDFSEELQKSSFRLIEPFFATLIKWYKGLDPSRPIDEDLKLFIEQAGHWKKSSEQLFRIRKTHHPSIRPRHRTLPRSLS